MLPASETTAAARGQVIDDFAVIIFGGEAEGDLPVWSDYGVVGVVLFYQEFHENQMA